MSDVCDILALPLMRPADYTVDPGYSAKDLLLLPEGKTEDVLTLYFI